MRKILLLLVLLLPSFACSALYECHEHDLLILSSAPCDTTWVPLSRYQSAPNSPATQSAVDSVSLNLNAAGGYVVPGMVQGASVVYLVDTGASRTAISSRVAVSAGLSACVSSNVTYTANGALQTCQVLASQITFGPFTLSNIPVTVMPNMQHDVLLGMDVLRLFKLNQQAGVLKISR